METEQTITVRGKKAVWILWLTVNHWTLSLLYWESESLFPVHSPSDPRAAASSISLWSCISMLDPGPQSMMDSGDLEEEVGERAQRDGEREKERGGREKQTMERRVWFVCETERVMTKEKTSSVEFVCLSCVCPLWAASVRCVMSCWHRGSLPSGSSHLISPLTECPDPDYSLPHWLGITAWQLLSQLIILLTCDDEFHHYFKNWYSFPLHVLRIQTRSGQCC